MDKSYIEGACVFNTKIGPFGMTWTRHGIDSTCLPDGNSTRFFERMNSLGKNREFLSELPRGVAEWAGRIAGQLSGNMDSLKDIPLDFGGLSKFAKDASLVLRNVGPGETISYGELAARIGRPGAARAIGRAMASNKLPLIVPCHRVLAANRGIGGFSSADGVAMKLRLLRIEGVGVLPKHDNVLDVLGKRDSTLNRLIDSVGSCDLFVQKPFIKVETLNRLDTKDPQLQRAIREAYELDKLPTQREVAEFGERWKPYRAVAAWYLLKHLKLAEPTLSNLGADIPLISL